MNAKRQAAAEERARDALALVADAPAVRQLPRDAVLALLEVLQRPWSSLALVPTEEGPWTLVFADALAQLALAFHLGSVRIVSTVGVSIEACERAREAVVTFLEAGDRVVVAVDPPHRTAGAVTTLAAAEAALLIVQLGSIPQDALRDVVRVIGRDRILGSIAIHPQAARRR
jgi:hypothetical protein